MSVSYAPVVDRGLLALTESVCAHFGVSVRLLRDRRRRYCRIRDEVVHVVRQLTGASYPELGDVFGRDHSSLVVGARRLEARLVVDELLRARVARLVGLAEGRAAS